uniref:Capsid protein n=1 Tax=Lycalopex gymnocercus torque teno virus 2 TaxID=2751164 RepID=A0A7D5G9U2_9VIRU|nr:ORF1 [Lycalopex gymnocercus torque teno virus 2]
MAFYSRPRTRYRRRWRPRRHFRRRRYRRRGRRYYHRRRGGRRWQTVREALPRKRHYLSVTGWEMLGAIGSNIHFTEDGLQVERNIKNNNEVHYFDKLITSQGKVSDKQMGFIDLCGGYGHADITLNGLIQRNQLGMNRFSEDLKEFHWIKFVGGWFQFPPNDEIDYLFRVEHHKPADTTQTQSKQKWNHPAHLINLPGTKIIESIYRSKCCRWKFTRFSPPAEFEGWYELQTFAKFKLLSYMWTTVDLSNPLGLAPYKNTEDPTQENNIEGHGALENSWWPKKGESRNCAWIDRKQYDDAFLRGNDKSWWSKFLPTSETKPKHTPFCPPVWPTDKPQSLWVRYKFKFMLGGFNIGNNFQNYPLIEYQDPPRQILSAEDIHPGELERNGDITARAFRRIIGADNQDEVERTQHLTEQELQLYKSLYYQLRRKRVTWGIVETREISPRKRLGIRDRRDTRRQRMVRSRRRRSL